MKRKTKTRKGSKKHSLGDSNENLSSPIHEKPAQKDPSPRQENIPGKKRHSSTEESSPLSSRPPAVPVWKIPSAADSPPSEYENEDGEETASGYQPESSYYQEAIAEEENEDVEINPHQIVCFSLRPFLQI